MLARDVTYHLLEPTQWANLIRLTGIFTPPRRSAGDEERAVTRGPVLFFVEAGKLVRAVDLTARRAFSAPPWEGPENLEAVRKELGAPWLLVFEDDALAQVLADVERSIRFGEDQLADALHVIHAVRKRIREGRGVHYTPQRFRRIPLPSYSMLRGAVDLLWPPQTAVCFYLFENGEPWTSLILARDEKGLIDLVTTDLALRPSGRGGPLARRASDHGALGRAIARVAGRPLHLGLFADRRALQRALSGETGAFERERSRGRLVLEPAPLWLRGVLGASEVARKARGAAGLFAAFAPRAVRDLAERVSSAAERAGVGAQAPLQALRAQLTQVLGFDPAGPDSPIIEALRWLRRTSGNDATGAPGPAGGDEAG